MDESPAPPQSVWPDLFGGAGMGLLLGTLVGLSSSPVVGVVVGALASVLAIFLGLDVSTGTVLGALRINGARIGALGVATVIGLGIGLYVRVNNPFLPDPEAKLQRWMAALPDDPTLAKQMMVLERTGIAPSRFQYGDALPGEDVTVAAQEGAAARQAVLFSALGDFNVCANLDPERSASTEVLLAVYRQEGAPEVLPRIAEIVAKLPADGQARALAMSHELLCFLQRESPD